MKFLIVLAVFASVSSVVISQELNKELESKILCENKFNYKVKWGKRFCAAKVLEGDLTDVNSTLPEAYLNIFGDNVPRESLVTRDTYRDWICGDIEARWPENLKGIVDESTLHCSTATAEYRKCLMAEDVKMIDEEVCKKKSKAASHLAKGFLSCLKANVDTNRDCWKDKMTQELNDENLENWMCIAPDNILKMYQTIFCGTSPSKRTEIVKCIDTAYAAMEL